METNIIIIGPDLDFGEFLRFIGIWFLMIANSGTKCAEYLSENTIDIFSGCSMCVNQYMSGIFLKVSALLSILLSPLPKQL